MPLDLVQKSFQGALVSNNFYSKERERKEIFHILIDFVAFSTKYLNAERANNQISK